MKKWDEVHNPNSCLNKAKDDETIFVILSRDKAAPNSVRFWAQERIDLGLNKPGDQKIIDAYKRAEEMEAEQNA